MSAALYSIHVSPILRRAALAARSHPYLQVEAGWFGGQFAYASLLSKEGLDLFGSS